MNAAPGIEAETSETNSNPVQPELISPSPITPSPLLEKFTALDPDAPIAPQGETDSALASTLVTAAIAQGSTLQLTLSPAWYDLSPAQQDSLADALARRSKGLDFGRLRLEDPAGQQLARSPVVGDQMVVLRR